MGRNLTDHLHIANSVNDNIVIEPGEALTVGGAPIQYAMSYPLGGFINKNEVQVIKFQDGPINRVGVNGVTHEALLAIVADRLRCFQDGPYACAENASALASIEEAQNHLRWRTRVRVGRGVEGTHQV